MTNKIKGSMNQLMYALRLNKEENLNLTNEQFEYLIKNTDLNKANNDGNNPLILALKYNQEQNLSNEQFDYLINNTKFNRLTEDYLIENTKLLNTCSNAILRIHVCEKDSLISNKLLGILIEKVTYDEELFKTLLEKNGLSEKQKSALLEKQVNIERVDINQRIQSMRDYGNKNDVNIKRNPN